MPEGALSCVDVSLVFGGTVALEGVSLEVAAGEIVGIIGPNGSGKTSLINIISGYYRPNSGAVTFDGARIEGRRPQELRRRGIARVFQNLRLYNEMTVLENMELGMALDMSTTPGVVRATCGAIVGRRQAQIRRAARQHAQELLAANGFGAMLNVRVGAMSYGQRKELELLRALLEPPRLLLLDEPTSGVAQTDAAAIKTRLLEWHQKFGFGVIIVEHRLGWLFDVASRIVALSSGTVLAEGSPQEVAANAMVRSTYVGG
jgi:ABC-type branched-subunit amino acid transport system ATPase component